MTTPIELSGAHREAVARPRRMLAQYDAILVEQTHARGPNHTHAAICDAWQIGRAWTRSAIG